MTLRMRIKSTYLSEFSFFFFWAHGLCTGRMGIVLYLTSVHLFYQHIRTKTLPLPPIHTGTPHTYTHTPPPPPPHTYITQIHLYTCNDYHGAVDSLDNTPPVSSHHTSTLACAITAMHVFLHPPPPSLTSVTHSQVKQPRKPRKEMITSVQTRHQRRWRNIHLLLDRGVECLTGSVPKSVLDTND